MESWFRRALTRGQRAGELAAGLDVKGVARTLWRCHKPWAWWRVNRDRQFVRAVAESAKRLLGTALTRSIAPSDGPLAPLRRQ